MTRFDAFEKKMRAEGLPPLAIETFRRYHALLASGTTGFLREQDIEPVDDLPDAAALHGFRESGREALASTVVIKLNGGLGTSMGLTRAKSLLPAKDGLTFLEMIVRQMERLRRTERAVVPLVLMNSFRTREDSLPVLAARDVGAPGIPLDFLQHKVPKVRADDLSPAVWPDDTSHEWCPPGHGDLYTALETSGLLEALLARGFVRAFVSNSDNLGAVVNLDILGWFASQRLPFLMEVCDRSEADKKGGHLARLRADGLVLREVAQTEKEDLPRFQDVARYRYFNTNSLWVDLRALRRALDEREGFLGLPLIVNTKTIDPADDASPRVHQLETAMGAAISAFEGAQALRVPRERFIPVKTTNDLLVLWSDYFALREDATLVPAPGREVGDIVVDLDPRFYRRLDQLEERFPKGAPSLKECRRLVVRGDVRFGRGCICRGDVSLVHEGERARALADGEVPG